VPLDEPMQLDSRAQSVEPMLPPMSPSPSLTSMASDNGSVTPRGQTPAAPETPTGSKKRSHATTMSKPSKRKRKDASIESEDNNEDAQEKRGDRLRKKDCEKGTECMKVRSYTSIHP
jgi:hypothetical protein